MVQYIQGMPIIKAFSRTEESFRAYATASRNARATRPRCADAGPCPCGLLRGARREHARPAPGGRGLYLAGASPSPPCSCSCSWAWGWAAPCNSS
jgi:hypothetical protein